MMTFYNLRYRYDVPPKLWRSGLGGVHFIVRDLPISLEEALLERGLFRDDTQRVWLDTECPYKPAQTFFLTKGADGVTRTRWPLDEKGLLALPFWSARRVIKRTRLGRK